MGNHCTMCNVCQDAKITEQILYELHQQQNQDELNDEIKLIKSPRDILVLSAKSKYKSNIKRLTGLDPKINEDKKSITRCLSQQIVEDGQNIELPKTKITNNLEVESKQENRQIVSKSPFIKMPYVDIVAVEDQQQN